MSAASLLALLRRLRVHGAISLARLVRIGTDERDIRTLLGAGLAAGTADGLALTREGAEFSFTDEPSLESLLNAYEQGERVTGLQALLEEEPAPQLSDEDDIAIPHPALERDWSTR